MSLKLINCLLSAHPKGVSKGVCNQACSKKSSLHPVRNSPLLTWSLPLLAKPMHIYCVIINGPVYFHWQSIGIQWGPQRRTGTPTVVLICTWHQHRSPVPLRPWASPWGGMLCSPRPLDPLFGSMVPHRVFLAHFLFIVFRNYEYFFFRAVSQASKWSFLLDHFDYLLKNQERAWTGLLLLGNMRDWVH